MGGTYRRLEGKRRERSTYWFLSLSSYFFMVLYHAHTSIIIASVWWPLLSDSRFWLDSDNYLHGSNKQHTFQNPLLSTWHWILFKNKLQGHLGGSVGWATDFSSGHDLAICEFKPHIRFCADSSEPGTCFGFCVSLSLCPSPTHACSLSVSEINIKSN